MKRNKLLITGFDMFGRLERNPSETLVQWLGATSGDDITVETLRTSYADSTAKVRQLIHGKRLGGFLMFGYSTRAHGLKLERFAQNADRSSAVDNDQLRGERVIIPDAPPCYPATADIDGIAELLEQAGSRARLSNDAGGYVCNHAYFIALHELARSGCNAPCMLVHIPDPKGEGEWETLKRGADALVRAFIDAASQSPRFK